MRASNSYYYGYKQSRVWIVTSGRFSDDTAGFCVIMHIIFANCFGIAVNRTMMRCLASRTMWKFSTNLHTQSCARARTHAFISHIRREWRSKRDALPDHNMPLCACNKHRTNVCLWALFQLMNWSTIFVVDLNWIYMGYISRKCNSESYLAKICANLLTFDNFYFADGATR